MTCMEVYFLDFNACLCMNYEIVLLAGRDTKRVDEAKGDGVGESARKWKGRTQDV